MVTMVVFKCLQIVQIIMKKLLPLFLFFAAASVSAQALNERWHGQWETPVAMGAFGNKVNVSANGVDACRWVGARPTQEFTGCVAFYADSVDKSALLEVTEFETQFLEKGLKEGFISAEIVPGIKKTMARNEQLLAGIEEGRFRTVMIEEGDFMGSGDCWTFLMLDKESVYSVYRCEGPAEPSLEIVQYSKR